MRILTFTYECAGEEVNFRYLGSSDFRKWVYLILLKHALAISQLYRFLMTLRELGVLHRLFIDVTTPCVYNLYSILIHILLHIAYVVFQYEGQE